MSCPDCFSGAVHEGEPRGQMTQVLGLPTYVSNPPEERPAKGIIVIIPDAFGIDFVNNKILADHYAEKGGYRVYLPDFMEGRSAPVHLLDKFRLFGKPGNYMAKIASVPGMVYNIVPWLMVNRPGASYPRVKTFFESLRKEEGSTVPVFAAGFCWGGKHVALLGADDVDGSLLVAAFTGHPSMLDVPGEIEKIHIPASFAVGDHDPHVPVDKAKEIQKIVEAKPDGQKGEMKIYDGCSHGFCVRADTGSFDVAQQAVAAEDQCIAWFDKHLKP